VISTILPVEGLGLAEREVLSSGWLTVYYYVQILRLTGRLCDEDVARRATKKIGLAVQEEDSSCQASQAHAVT
jgi:hypothetical protein